MKMELLIQKICACSPKDLIVLFHEYLTKNKHNLSAQLIKLIQENPNENILFYVKSIYKNESKESIKKLNQLAHHTLKLFSFISQKFPSFLWHNIQELEWLIFKNEKEIISEKIKILKEVADKFENYQLLIQLSRIVKQQTGLDKLLVNSLVNNKSITYLNEVEHILSLQNNIRFS